MWSYVILEARRDIGPFSIGPLMVYVEGTFARRHHDGREMLLMNAGRSYLSFPRRCLRQLQDVCLSGDLVLVTEATSDHHRFRSKIAPLPSVAEADQDTI